MHGIVLFGLGYALGCTSRIHPMVKYMLYGMHELRALVAYRYLVNFFRICSIFTDLKRLY